MLRRVAPLPLARLLLACSAGFASCAPERDSGDAPPPVSITVEDASGRTVGLNGPALRIVSLVPSATQTLVAIGAGDRLVGRTDFDTGDWTLSLPSVGGGLEPNLEVLLALEPDLVVRFAGDQDPRTPGRLDQLGIPHIAVRPDRIMDVYAAVRLLGTVTGRQAQADSVVSRIQSDLDAVRLSIVSRPRVTAAYVLGGTPPWVAGPGTYIAEVMDLVGADNVFDDLGSLYSAVSPEQIRIRPIEVVLLTSPASFDRSLAPNARVLDVGDALEIPGPNVAAAARMLAELIHGPLGG